MLAAMRRASSQVTHYWDRPVKCHLLAGSSGDDDPVEAMALSAKFPVCAAIAHANLAQFFLVKARLAQFPAPSSSWPWP